MPPIHSVNDAHDPRLSDYRAVSRPSLAAERGLYVAEGRLVVERVIAAQPTAVRSLLLNPAAFAALETATSSLPEATPVYVGPPSLFEALTGVDIHRGCLAIVERPREPAIEELIASSHLMVGLEDCGNADNMGAVFRNAAAFGVDALVLSPGCCDPLYRKSVRTSMAAVSTMSWARASNWLATLDGFRTAGIVLIALTPRSPALTLDEFADMPRPDRLALLVGSEGDGLSDAALARADHRVRIPMTRSVDSLNLAVSTGIVLSRLSGPSISGTR